MNKKALTETGIRTKFMSHASVGRYGSKWNAMAQRLEERYFTKNRVIVPGIKITRSEAKKANYLLSYKPNIPLAVVEAKDNDHYVHAGMQQAWDYAETLNLPFAYNSNGDAFFEHDCAGAANIVERKFPFGQFLTA